MQSVEDGPSDRAAVEKGDAGDIGIAVADRGERRLRRALSSS
jgi:hypothetical protein